MSAQPKLQIDWIACNGYGVCWTSAPHLVVLDDWGYPVLPDGPVSPDLVPQA
jgi:ferredoxin